MSDFGNKAKDIFLGALEQSGDLEAFLAEACGDDTELRERVQALLDAHHEAGDFLAPSRLDETMASGKPARMEMTHSSSATASVLFGLGSVGSTVPSSRPSSPSW